MSLNEQKFCQNMFLFALKKRVQIGQMYIQIGAPLYAPMPSASPGTVRALMQESLGKDAPCPSFHISSFRALLALYPTCCTQLYGISLHFLSHDILEILPTNGKKLCFVFFSKQEYFSLYFNGTF
uniref:Uncharacterized protein n=1 Tax=Xenopus tropicalis TaxID=8364 RepID=A0A1B8XXH3_XENTR